MKHQAILFAVAFLISTPWSQTMPDQVAANSLQGYLQVAEEAPEVFPLLTNGATLGGGIPYFADSLGNQPTEYLYEVQTNLGTAMLLRVALINELWQAQEIGFVDLAREISLVREAWPLQKGYSISIILNTQEKGFYFTIPEVETENQTPIAFGGLDSKLAQKYSQLTPKAEK